MIYAKSSVTICNIPSIS